jgi:hypothetical protein
MQGTLTQLGLSNYLINKSSPANSFFQHQYANYSNFARDTRRVPFKSNVDFGKIGSARLDEFARYGDLITNISIQMELPDISGITTSTGKGVGYCNGIGNAVFETIEITIGGISIDIHPSEWMDIWSQLSIKPGFQNTENSNVLGPYGRLIKKYKPHTYQSFQGGSVYCPLNFWFCNYSNDDSSSFVLPIAALNNTTMEIKVKTRNFKDLIVIENNDASLPIGSFSMGGVYLLIDFVTLEVEERIQLLNVPRQFFLIQQLQYQSYNIPANSTQMTISLRDFKYPISELLWVVRRNDSISSNDYFNYGDSLVTLKNDPILTTRITFEGQDRVPELDSDFFSTLEPLKTHSNCPNTFIHCYSFAIKPEDIINPSGVCNFSDLSEPNIIFTFKQGLANSTLYIYGLNYNVLQTNEKGQAYLLHSLSKASPANFPTAKSSTSPDC